jgi:hypothetical protein
MHASQLIPNSRVSHPYEYGIKEKKGTKKKKKKNHSP